MPTPPSSSARWAPLVRAGDEIVPDILEVVAQCCRGERVRPIQTVTLHEVQRAKRAGDPVAIAWMTVLAQIQAGVGERMGLQLMEHPHAAIGMLIGTGSTRVVQFPQEDPETGDSTRELAKRARAATHLTDAGQRRNLLGSLMTDELLHAAVQPPGSRPVIADLAVATMYLPFSPERSRNLLMLVDAERQAGASDRLWNALRPQGLDAALYRQRIRGPKPAPEDGLEAVALMNAAVYSGREPGLLHSFTADNARLVQETGDLPTILAAITATTTALRVEPEAMHAARQAVLDVLMTKELARTVERSGDADQLGTLRRAVSCMHRSEHTADLMQILTPAQAMWPVPVSAPAPASARGPAAVLNRHYSRYVQPEGPGPQRATGPVCGGGGAPGTQAAPGRRGPGGPQP